MKINNWIFAVFAGLVLTLAGSNLTTVRAQSTGGWAIAQAQRVVREQITKQEGGRWATVTFNRNAQTEARSNGDVRVSGTGAFVNNNNGSRNNNRRTGNAPGREFTYEATVSNRNRNNRNNKVFDIRYELSGNWLNNNRGNNDLYGNYRNNNRPNGRVSYSGPITNRHSDKALDVTEQGLQDGANIQQWSYADQPNQNWEVFDLGNNEIAIISRHSGKALTVQGGRDNNGANIIQRSWNDTPQQRWRLEQVGGDYYKIVSVDNGKCLDVTAQGKQNGANVQLWDYANQSNQQWKLKR